MRHDRFEVSALGGQHYLEGWTQPFFRWAPRNLFKFLHDLPMYAPGHRKEDIASILVTDFYNLERLDARKALFVVGSDVPWPDGS